MTLDGGMAHYVADPFVALLGTLQCYKWSHNVALTSHLLDSIFPIAQLCCWVDTWLAPFPPHPAWKNLSIGKRPSLFRAAVGDESKKEFCFFSPVWVQVARLDTRLLLLADALALKEVFTTVNFHQKMHKLVAKCYKSFFNCRLWQ
jgi:hypothetical protein